MKLKRIVASVAGLIIVIGAGGLAYVSLVLLDPERIKPFLAQQVQSATGRTLVIEGDFKPTLSLTPTLAISQVSLSNADWGKAKQLLKAETLEMSFSLLPLLTGQLQIDALKLDGAQIWLEQKGDKRNWEFAQKSKKEDEAETKEATNKEDEAADFSVKHLSVSDSELHFSNLKQAKSYALHIAQFKMHNANAERIEQIQLQGRYEQAELTVNGSMAQKVLQLDGQAELAHSSAQLKGSLSLQDLVFDAQLSLDSQDISELLALSGNKSSNHTPLKAQAILGGTTKLININKLALTYDKHALTGTGKLDLMGAKPSIQGAINLEQLDLRSAIQKVANDDTPRTPDAHVGIVSRDPLPFDALHSANARLDIGINEITTNSGQFTKVAAQLVLHDGKLVLSNIKANKADGSLSGSLTANANASPPSVALALDSRKLTVGGLLNELSGADSIAGGKITANLTLNGAGQSLHAILGGASGSYDMLVEEATYTPPEGVQEARRFFDVLRGSTGNGPVEIKCGIVQFGIDGGLAKSKALAVQSPNAIVSGEGVVNLRGETLKIHMKARSTLLGFADVVPPLVIGGAWNNIGVTLSAKNTLLNIGKYALGAVSGVGLVAIVGEQFTDRLGITADNNPCMKSINEAAEKAAKADANPKASLKSAEKTYLENRNAIKDNVKGAIKGGKKEIKNLEQGLKGLKGLLGK